MQRESPPYSDGELARAIRHGVKKDHTAALFMMSVGPVSDEDLTAVVSYLRSIPGVDRATKTNEIGLLGKILFQGPMDFFAAPHDYGAPPFVPEGEPSVERGKYLAEGPAFCTGCHSKIEAVDAQITFVGPVAGGRIDPNFPDETEEGFAFVSPNLTPHATAVTNDWTQETFIKRIRNGRAYAGSPMPWETYQNMTDDDLISIWSYLQQLPPADNAVGPSRGPT